MYRIPPRVNLRGKVHVGTYLTLHRCTGEAGQRDRQSRLSSTQSTSRIEVRADHSLPNLPACTYLPYLVPSNIKYVQQSSPVQSTSLSHHHHHPMLPVRESSTSQVPVPSPSHPIPSHPTPAQPTCVHNNPCEIRPGRLGRRQHLARSFRCVGTSTCTCTCTKGM